MGALQLTWRDVGWKDWPGGYSTNCCSAATAALLVGHARVPADIVQHLKAQDDVWAPLAVGRFMLARQELLAATSELGLSEAQVVQLIQQHTASLVAWEEVTPRFRRDVRAFIQQRQVASGQPPEGADALTSAVVRFLQQETAQDGGPRNAVLFRHLAEVVRSRRPLDVTLHDEFTAMRVALGSNSAFLYDVSAQTPKCLGSVTPNKRALLKAAKVSVPHASFEQAASQLWGHREVLRALASSAAELAG